MTFSNVVFYLERLQNKEPITTHVITIATSGNLLLEEFIVNDNSQDVHDWIEHFELKTDLLIFESSAKLPDDETRSSSRKVETYVFVIISW